MLLSPALCHNCQVKQRLLRAGAGLAIVVAHWIESNDIEPPRLRAIVVLIEDLRQHSVFDVVLDEVDGLPFIRALRLLV